MLYSLLQYVCQMLCLVVFNYRLYGGRHLPRTGGILLAANHQSFLDPILFAVALPRPVHFMARESLFRNPLFRLLIRSLNAFPVRRGSADRAAIRHAIELLRSGEVVLMFPEATRTPDGRIGTPQAGLAMIAAKANSCIVPAVVEGAFRSWPRHRLLARPARIRVQLGPPISPQSLTNLSHEEVSAYLRQHLLALQAALRSRPNL